MVRLNVLFLSSYSSCCWISLANGGNGNWLLSTTVNLTKRQDNGKINSSPISALSPIVRHQQGCSKTIAIPAEDSDGDKVRCRWSTGSRRECGGVCHRFSYSGTLDEVSQLKASSLVYTSKFSSESNMTNTFDRVYGSANQSLVCQ